MPIENNMLNNRYKLLAQVAAGGMALVYKAQDTMLNRIVAVKIMRETFATDPAFQKRFMREAQSAANLSHPNIVTVYDFGRDGDLWYIVMEYIEGKDLKSIIRADAPLPLGRALNIAMQICSGVGAAHRAGVVHCDVKPQNVIVTPEGHVKVTDFGIARAFSAAAPGGYTESVWGTPHYFSPEQAAGEKPTPASDVYSIGVILFEMLTGRLPFQGDNQAQLALAHIRDAPPPITKINPQVPLRMEHIINQTLAKEQANRFRTADQLCRVLSDYQQVAEQQTGLQQPVALPAAPPSPRPAVPPPPTPVSNFRPAPPPETYQKVTTVQRQGVDWLAWMLAMVAIAAVVGVIILWVIVYQRYTSAERIPSASLDAPTSMPVANFKQSVSVPDLARQERTAAEGLLTQLGLRLAIKEERPDDKAPPGTVLEQVPGPGSPARPGDTVQVVLSKGPKVSNVVNLQGYYPYTDSLKGLESAGWQVTIQPQWSTKQAGEILSQIPAPGTPLTAGQMITLVVSSGNLIPLDVNFSQVITLESATLPYDSLRPGETLSLALNWKSRVAKIQQPYKVFIHLLGPDGRLIAQIDREPQEGRAATLNWNLGELVPDQYTLEIPRNAPRGTYQLRTGMYLADNPTQRLAVADPGKTTQEGNSVLIKTLTISP